MVHFTLLLSDDHSRKIWVYPLKSKDQVLDVFKQFQALSERQTGKKLKYIRTDNGGEYIGSFDDYCRLQGILHQKTPPKIPQLNSLAERMNKTLVERVTCVLLESKLPNSFWAEALNIVAGLSIFLLLLLWMLILQEDFGLIRIFLMIT